MTSTASRVNTSGALTWSTTSPAKPLPPVPASPSTPPSSSSSSGTHNPLSHSMSKLSNFMSTSFPTRTTGKSPRGKEEIKSADALREDFDRKIAAVVSCLQEKAEENIDLSNKLKTLQEQSRKREEEKERTIEDLQKTLKSKEDCFTQSDKEVSARDEFIRELERRIQTITLCLNEMAEENIRLKVIPGAEVASTKNNNTNKHNSNNNKTPTKGAANEPGKIVWTPSPGPSPPITPSSSRPLSPIHTPSFTFTPTANSLTTTPSPSPSALLSAITLSAPDTSSPPSSFKSGAASDFGGPLVPSTSSSKSEDMAIILDEYLKDTNWFRKFHEKFLTNIPPTILELLANVIEQDKAKLESRVRASMDDATKDMGNNIKLLEEKVADLSVKLQTQKDRATSSEDSVQEYERKLKELETRMWDNLNKEAQRRTDAEFSARRLKKKVEELQFLLDELKDDNSDASDDDESDSAESDEKSDKKN